MLRRLLRRVRSGTTPIHECRNCGTTVENTEVDCPNCGCEEIATYCLEEETQ